MKYSSTFLLATSALFNLIQAAPAPAVITVTAYTTVIVDQSGVTHTPENQIQNQAQTQGVEEPDTTISSLATLAPSTSVILGGLTTSLTSTTPISIATNPTTSSSPTSTSSSSSTSTSQPTGGSTFSGEGTFYTPGLGACGSYHDDSDYIIAISHELYDSKNIGNNPNNNPLCNKKIRAYYNGNSVDVTVVDRCEGCAYNDLDFSPTAFSKLADQSLGRIDITWEWL
ncbi:DAG7 [Candida pseudojiufengensis]|uniref:DAG7 n=1 Tax=Candida pseudojiufengensis TaxID=497109 RepID=UPI0022246FEA|nr:DAG7 [Candida pseudojiufengensis]KAI5962127.1 DAG7 [Candida pseudojiufengensis]